MAHGKSHHDPSARSFVGATTLGIVAGGLRLWGNLCCRLAERLGGAPGTALDAAERDAYREFVEVLREGSARDPLVVEIRVRPPDKP